MTFSSVLRLALLIAASAAQARADGYQCQGTAPDWALRIDGDQAQFEFPARTEMEVKLETRPQGEDWPRALTLIGDSDTAIVLLERDEATGVARLRARVLTQRGQTPVLLTGACADAP